MPFLSLHLSKEVLLDNDGHATKGAPIPRRAPHGNNIYATHAAHLSVGCTRDGKVRTGQGDGAARARDVWSSVWDCDAAGGRRAGGPADYSSQHCTS